VLTIATHQAYTDPDAGSSLARQQRLVRLLDQGGGLSVPRAAADLGCTERTVYRDLVVLQEIGVPRSIRNAKANVLRWRLVDAPTPPAFPSRSACRDARADRRPVTSWLGWPAPSSTKPPSSALEKIRAALPPNCSHAPTPQPDLVVTDKRPSRNDYPRPWRRRADPGRRIERRETVTIEYRKIGDRARRFGTWTRTNLHVHAGALYLIGWCHRRKAVRTFLLDRAGRVRATGRTFDRRSDISLRPPAARRSRPLDRQAEVIRLRFRSTAARLVAERKIHPSQISELRLDGGLDVSLHAPITLGWNAG